MLAVSITPCSMHVYYHPPIVFQCTGSTLRPRTSLGQVSTEMLRRAPVGEPASGRVRKELGKGSWQYSGTRGSHGPLQQLRAANRVRTSRILVMAAGACAGGESVTSLPECAETEIIMHKICTRAVLLSAVYYKPPSRRIMLPVDALTAQRGSEQQEDFATLAVSP